MPAARVNVMGAWAMAQEAADDEVERMIMVSSDNAAHARRRFDAIQALAECAVRGHAGRGTVLAALRVRNVFRSSGSVVERFERHVSYGGPVTVTDAAAALRFVSRHPVGQRLLSLAEFAEDGAVYALDAGAHVEIRDLARRVIQMKAASPTPTSRSASPATARERRPPTRCGPRTGSSHRRRCVTSCASQGPHLSATTMPSRL